MKKTEPEYYPPVENLLDLIYEHYTENNPVEKNTVAGKAAKAKEKELEEWLRGLEGMDRLRNGKGDPSAEYGGQRILAEQISQCARAPFGRATALEVVEGGAIL